MTKPVLFETTAETIDEESTKADCFSAYERTIALFDPPRKGELEIFGQELLEKEILSSWTWKSLLVTSFFEKETTYRLFTNKKESAPEVVNRQTGHSGDTSEE